MNKEDLLNLLQTKEVQISFVKKDGSTRKMFCTLKPEIIPEVNGTSGSQKNENHIVVYDIEKEGWRTLNLETKWEVIL